MKVCKFGGTSMANTETIQKVAEICKSDKDRKYVIVSAPGKRDAGDIKVTDSLYACFKAAQERGECVEEMNIIRKRFADIEEGLGIDINSSEQIDEMEANVLKNGNADYIASRGEYLSAQVLAAYLGYEFVDTEKLIKFNDYGELMLDYSSDLLRKRLHGVKYAVIPGFYGSDAEGKLKTFSRGGSDITGAIVAHAMAADIYENWTDVDGFLTADPRIVSKPERISFMSYKELRELSYMGAEVLHPESVFPVRLAGIPINIRNTFNPDHPGTMIVPSTKLPKEHKIITGIAGKKGFTIINIEKDLMNSEIGFGRKVLSVLECEGIPWEHMPSGIDTLSVVLRDELVLGKMQRIINNIRESTQADNVEIHSGLSLIAIVGHNMASRQGTAQTVFEALAYNHINVRMIDQGSSELNIIVGVDTFDYEKAINAIYHAFMD